MSTTDFNENIVHVMLEGGGRGSFQLKLGLWSIRDRRRERCANEKERRLVMALGASERGGQNMVGRGEQSKALYPIAFCGRAFFLLPCMEGAGSI